MITITIFPFLHREERQLFDVYFSFIAAQHHVVLSLHRAHSIVCWQHKSFLVATAIIMESTQSEIIINKKQTAIAIDLCGARENCVCMAHECAVIARSLASAARNALECSKTQSKFQIFFFILYLFLRRCLLIVYNRSTNRPNYVYACCKQRKLETKLNWIRFWHFIEQRLFIALCVVFVAIKLKTKED